MDTPMRGKPNWIKRIVLSFSIVISFISIAFLIFVYQVGAWNVLFPSNKHEDNPPNIPVMADAPSILLFTKTNAFRHKGAIRTGSELFEQLSAHNSWNIYATENGAIFNERDLETFDVVIFHNVTGNTLSDDQQKVMEHWLQSGGGWLGTHAAGDGSHFHWPWYMKNLIGVSFTAHTMGPQFQTAEVINEATAHPVMFQLPAAWPHEEEWYSWEQSPRQEGFSILASIDESTYLPEQNLFGRKTNLRMGDHPVVWRNCIGEGRAIYSALGHSAAAYQNENHIRLLENALAWLINADQTECT